MKIEHILHTVLANTLDPFMDLTPLDMQMKIQFKEDDGILNTYLQAGFPTEKLKTTLLPLLNLALQEALPNQPIDLTLDTFIRAHRTQFPGSGLKGVKNTIAIASGKGGVGKSTVTVNLAVALAKMGARVGILDADIYGPSIPLMLGKAPPVEVCEEYYLPILVHGIQAMSIGYMTNQEQALIWRGPMLAKSLLQLINLTRWDNLDYLLIDLPPGTGDIQLSLVQKIPLSTAIVVTTPQQVATLDAQKAITMFEKTGIHVLGLVENMSTHHCSHCGHEEPIFGEGGARALAKAHGLKLLGQLPLDRRIVSQCDAGNPIAALEHDPLANIWVKTALQAAIELSRRPINFADKFPM